MTFLALFSLWVFLLALVLALFAINSDSENPCGRCPRGRDCNCGGPTP